MTTSTTRRRLCASGLAAVLAVAGLLAGADPALAASTTISGDITLEGGGVAANANVELDDTSGNYLSDVYANSSGHYQIGAGSGTYNLVVTKTSGGVSYYYSGTVTVGTNNVTKNIVLVRDFTCGNQIVGTHNVGQTLTAVNTVTPGEPFAYTDQEWYRYTVDGGGTPLKFTEIPGATGTTYTLTDADQGYRIAYYAEILNASNSRYGECSSVDGGLRPVVGGRLAAPVSSVGVAGQAKVGKTLSASPGALPAGVVGTYQWFRVAKAKKGHKTVIKPIGGATAPSYKLKKKDKGTKVFVTGTYSGGGYTAKQVSSTPVKVKG